MKNYFINYKNDNNTFTLYSNATKQITTVSYKDLPMKYNYDMLNISKSFEATQKDLIKFANLFEQWTDELRDNDIYTIDWTSMWMNKNVIIQAFKQISEGITADYEKIDITEANWMHKTYNAGIIFGAPGLYESYGYDYSFFYPKIMASPTFKFPTKRGTEINIDFIPEFNLVKVGFYQVKITSKNDNAKKIFAFSKYDTYTHSSLLFAMMNKEYFNIELIQDDKPNAYVYNDIITGDKVFGKWYETLIKLRERFPNNKLIKTLGSSLWGQLSAKNAINKTFEQIEKDNMDVGLTDKSRYKIIDEGGFLDNEYFKLLDTQNPYKYNVRLKCFLTAFGRNKTGRLALKDIDNVIRIHTDGVAFKQPQEFDKILDRTRDITTIHEEDKTTGLIYFKNCNNYTNITKNATFIKSIVKKLKISQTY